MQATNWSHPPPLATPRTRYALLVLAFLALVGCGSIPVEPEYRPGREPEQGTGLLVGSLVRQAPGTRNWWSPWTRLMVGGFGMQPPTDAYHSLAFYYGNKSTKRRYMISWSEQLTLLSREDKDEFAAPESKGALFAHELPKGSYHFTNFQMVRGTPGYSGSTWYSREPYSIPFEIVPGMVNYVGEIRLVPRLGENVFGITIPAGGSWEIRDQRERDITLLKEKFPDLNWDSVNIVVPDRKDITTPFVLLPSELDAVE